MTVQEVRNFFNSLNWSGAKKFYDQYSDFLLSDHVDKDCKFPEEVGGIVCFVVRCDDKDIAFNQGSYNDYEFVMEITAADETGTIIVWHEYKVTADPCRMKNGIAHTARQIYCGNVGFHHGDENRICIRSDRNGTWIRRTNENGDPVLLAGHVDSRRDCVGINNHDQGAFFDSSLGCIIFFGGGWMVKNSPYASDFAPLLERCTNKKTIPMCIIDRPDMDDIIIWTPAA